MLLKKDRCGRSPRFWTEAVHIVEVSAERLELDEMHMEGVGILRQSENRLPGCPLRLKSTDEGASSMAPNARNDAFCASVTPLIPVISSRS